MSFLLLHSLIFCVLFNIRTPYMYQSGSRVGVSVCDITCGRTPPAARITLANTLFAHISGLNAHAAIVTALIERRQAGPLRLALMRLILDFVQIFISPQAHALAWARDLPFLFLTQPLR